MTNPIKKLWTLFRRNDSRWHIATFDEETQIRETLCGRQFIMDPYKESSERPVEDRQCKRCLGTKGAV